MPTLCNPREHVSRGARMFRQHAGESIPRGRGWDGPGLEGDPLLAELRIVSEWAQLRGTEASELPVPSGICKPCKSSPHGGLIAGTLVRCATSVASAMALAGLRPGEVRLALLAVVCFRRGLLCEVFMIKKGYFVTDLPPSGEG